MKKLIIIFATLGLMFQITGCTGKKTQDDTEVIENADVERIEAEDALFAGDTSADEGVDDSLQAALGEAPVVDDVAATAPSAETDLLYTDNAGTEMAEAPAPSIDEEAMFAEMGGEEVAQNSIESGITEAPVVETPVDTSFDAPTQELALDNSSNLETDLDLYPDTTATVADTNTTDTVTETPVTETPMTDSYASSFETETPSPSTYEDSITAAATTVAATPKKPVTAANSTSLQKIAETTPYMHGDGYVNAVYIARPQEKLADISQIIYGMDKTSELKAINSFIKWREPKAGEKIYYISPNRPSDSTRMLSFYEDTGMVPSTYVAQKGDNLKTVAKNLLGYDGAWKEMWTTNSVQSKSALKAGDTLSYWKPAEAPSTPTLALNDGNAKLVDAAPEMAAPPIEPAPEMAYQQQELPPPPPMPEPQMDTQDVAMNTPPEFQPPQEEMAYQQQELPPPPPMPQDTVAPVPPPQAAAPNMEEEMAIDGLSSDTTMMMGVVVVLVALLALVLIRRNKKKREAEMSGIEHTHVGT